MSRPVPGFRAQTPFHRRGPLWRTCGVRDRGLPTQTGLHTGVDIPAPEGTAVVAARAGVTKQVDFGSLFGDNQLVVLCDDGTEDFYAHMRARTAGGRRVRAGDKIGEVGNNTMPGLTLGFHLHFERHNQHASAWGCSIIVNPAPSLHAGPDGVALSRRILLSELRLGETNSSSVRRLQRALNMHREGDLPLVRLTGDYLDDTDEAVRMCQQRHGFGGDPDDQSRVGPMQAVHLFGTKRQLVDDL